MAHRRVEEVQSTLSNLKAEFLPAITITGAPTPEINAVIVDLAAAIAQKHRELMASQPAPGVR